MAKTSSSVGSRWAWLPLLALLPIAFTLLGWRQSAKQAEADIRKELRQNIEGTARALEDRLHGYAHLLEGARGFLAVSDETERGTWARYVRQVNTNGRFPGLHVVAYGQRMKPDDAEAFMRTMKRKDANYIPVQFEILGERYVSVATERYGDPLPPRKFGEVIRPDDTRQGVIRQAIDEARAVISPPLRLAADRDAKMPRPGLFMVLPWYGEQQPKTVAERRRDVRGLLYATWHAQPLAQEIIGRQMGTYPFRIYSGGNSSQVLYQDPRWAKSGVCAGYSDSQTILSHGQQWTIEACDNRDVSSMPAYLQTHRWLSMGTLGSFLLLGIGYLVLRQRSESLSAAEKMQAKHMNLSHRLRNIATRVPVLIAHLDKQGRFLFANELYSQWFGIDTALLEGKDPEEVFGAALGGELSRNVQRALAGESFRQELRIETRIFDVHYTPETTEGGEVTGAYVVASDISKHKQMERYLSEEKERVEVTLTSLGEAVVSFDPHGRIIYANPATHSLLKLDIFSLLGKQGRDVLHFLDGKGLPMDGHPLDGLLLDGQKRTYLDLFIENSEQALIPVEATLSAMKDDEGHIIGAAVVIRDVSQSREMSKNLMHMAHHDALTGLANRVEIYSRIDDLLSRPNQIGALVFLDLDHFKNINDTLGHEVGDHVLREVAQRIRDIVGQGGYVARQGGDEFLILLPGASQQRAEKTTQKMLDALIQPFLLDHRILRIAASAGISLFPQEGSDRIELMRQADAAMYAAKRSGRNHAMLFESAMGEYAEQRMSIEQGLRDALTSGGLLVAYQPKIDASSNTMAGYEALVRWNRDGKILQPNSFIHIAEECGLIGAIDLWVLHEACRQQAKWLADGLSPLPCSVNVSMAWLDAVSLLGCVDEALAETNIPAHLLQLEFTETQVMHDGDQARTLIGALRARGVSVALDDFGTGYSNLSSLNSFGFDTVKIDRSFIQELTDAKRLSLVRAIISIGRAHGHTIVAEGVETESQASILAREGCHHMQGFLYSPPVDPAQIRTWLTHPFTH